jgi:hypothetical protein
MKTMLKVFVILSMLTLALASCDLSGGSITGSDITENGVTQSKPRAVYETDTTDGRVTIEIYGNSLEFETSPQDNDSYVLRLNGVIIDRGFIVIAGATWNFFSESGSSFSATVTNGVLVIVVIIYSDGSIGDVNAPPTNGDSPPQGPPAPPTPPKPGPTGNPEPTPPAPPKPGPASKP